MTSHYDHAQVQEFWQYVWERDDVYALPEDATDPTYVLGMFPYTSGTLHMGHIRNYAITDAYARYRRMQGDDVLHPMGWDAFGLPAENAAHERASDPGSWTQACIRRMREGLEAMGFGYDWDREITTCEPSYYRWNQWLFKRFHEAGLVDYEAASVNWCPDCETVLADAQVEVREDAAEPIEGASESEIHAGETRVCWRCETPVGRRELDQWFFTITDYAEELDAGLDDLEEWPEGVREMQRNWIGRQEGAHIAFEVADHGSVDVFTTRPETVGGATYLAVSPGHELAEALAEADDAVAEYVRTARERDPSEVGFSGVATEATAVNPLTGAALPVYVAGYVLDDVGTGAVMGVPGHNERDHAFATEHGLPVEQVIEPEESSEEEGAPYTGEGSVADDGAYDGVPSEEARERLVAEHEAVEEAVTYRLRDWLISRQRYWGTPIPMVHCEDCGRVPVPDEDLPVELPEFVRTTGNPLDEADEWKETTCPDCGGPAARETDTMDTFVDSSWYFLRFLSPEYDEGPFDPDRAAEWMPIDVYVGGEEHAVLHLLYIRFVTRALADMGLLEDREPVSRLVSQGAVLYEGEKMSNTRENVVTPGEYGAETTRLFVLSAAHPEQDFEWTANNVRGVYDLQQSLYGMATAFIDETETRIERTDRDEYLDHEIDRTIAATTEEYERFRFHRAVSEIQGLARLLRRYREYGTPHEAVYRRGLLTLSALIAPMAPHLGEELWNKLRGDGLVVLADWPEPESETGRYRAERRTVERTIADVRDIVDTASIEDPDRIELTVAAPWKYRVLTHLIEADDEGAAIEAALADDAIDVGRERTAAVASETTPPRGEPGPLADADAEYAVLSQARWLFEDEFGASVTIHRESKRSTETDARPGKPAIEIA
ncbi:leucine--tRNA ligase [Halobacteria archaeon AArc-dxtr1]|nr:leucine--tRNA ligase [Halobacteria archaeon AArc-dxtr1]